MQENFSLTCTVCNNADYAHWKLIGFTNDLGCQVVKCVLPYFLCERCYRKRFCHQESNLLTCGVAVFSPADFLVYAQQWCVKHSNSGRHSYQMNKRLSLQLQPVSSNVVHCVLFHSSITFLLACPLQFLIHLLPLSVLHLLGCLVLLASTPR